MTLAIHVRSFLCCIYLSLYCGASHYYLLTVFTNIMLFISDILHIQNLMFTHNVIKFVESDAVLL